MMVAFKPNHSTLHALPLLGCLPKKLPHMANGIIPDTCLWVLVKGVSDKIFGPFAVTAPPGEDLIEGALLQFTAQA